MYKHTHTHTHTFVIKVKLKRTWGLGAVALTYNLSYLGGRDQKD
jgi:hypothetical protein